MGHDIYGYHLEEVSYLRRSMRSAAIHRFYEALGAEKYDGGVSGTGESIIVRVSRLKRALTAIRKMGTDDDSEFTKEDKADFVEFINETIDGKDKDDYVAVGFY